MPTATPEQWKTTVLQRLPNRPATDAIARWWPVTSARVAALAEWRPSKAAATDAIAVWRPRVSATAKAVAQWRPPSPATVKATLLALTHIAGVEGFACKRVLIDLWDVDQASPDYAHDLVRRAFQERNADRLVILNADPQTAQHLNAAAAAHGVAYRVSVFQRLNDLLPFT